MTLIDNVYSPREQQWADFSQTADYPPETFHHGDRNDPNPPYVLVHSHSQTDFSSTPAHLPSAIETNFKNASYANLYAFTTTLSEEQRRHVAWEVFMVLDEDSARDRKAVFIHKGLEYVRQNGEVVDFSRHRDPLTKREVWKKFRVPFEEAFEFGKILEIMPGNEDQDFLQNTTRASAVGL